MSKSHAALWELPHRIKRSRFVRAFGLVSGGTIAGQIVGLLAVPLLSRWYTTVAYGEFGIFVAVSAALAAVACLRLDLAVPRCTTEDDADMIASAGVLSSILFGVVMMLAMVAVGGVFPGLKLSRATVFMLPLSTFLGGAWAVLNQMAIRKGQFRAVALRAVIQPAAMLCMQGLWFAFSLPGPGLIVGYVVGKTVALVPYLMNASRALSFDRTRCWRSVLAHRQYIQVMMPQGVLNTLNTQLPLLMIGWLFSSEITGQFSMTQRVMGLPVGLIGVSMGQVYVSFLAQSASLAARRLFMRVSGVLMLTGGLLIVVTTLTGPVLFSLVLGSKWAVSGEYAQIMVFMFAAQLVAAPLSTTLVVMRQERRQAGWDVLRLCILMFCFIVGRTWSLSPSAFAAVLSGGTVVAYSWLWNLSRQSVSHPVSRI